MSKAGYNVSWTGSSITGRVRIVIAQSETNVHIACDSTGSSAAIPASALSDLVPGNDNTKQISIVIGGFDENHLTNNGWDVRIQAVKASYSTVTFVQ